MKPNLSLCAATAAAALFANGCGSSSPGAASDAGTLPDVRGVDLDAAIPVSGDDSGATDTSSSSCPTPADISTWTPPALKPAAVSATACTRQNITDYYNACQNNLTRTSAACTAYTAQNATCASCLVSGSTDAAWGPLVKFGSILVINAGGCVSIVDPPNATCAASEQHVEECIHSACDGVCAITSDPASFADWQACEGNALNEACNSFAVAASCVTVDDATAPICDVTSNGPYQSFDEAFLAIAPIFCAGASAVPEGGATESGAGDAGSLDGGAPETGNADSGPSPGSMPDGSPSDGPTGG